MIQLGKVYRDSHTGFEGTATARTEFLYGCVRVMLEAPKLKDDGTPKEAWFDEQRLVAHSPATSGGPREAPPRRADRG